MTIHQYNVRVAYSTHIISRQRGKRWKRNNLETPIRWIFHYNRGNSKVYIYHRDGAYTLAEDVLKKISESQSMMRACTLQQCQGIP